MDERRPGYYAVIPAEVRYDDVLPPNAKLLYGELTALAAREGYCFAQNAYFCELYKLCDSTITKLLTSLEKRGYIRREVERDADGKVAARKIWINQSTSDAHPPVNIYTTSHKDLRDPPVKITDIIIQVLIIQKKKKSRLCLRTKNLKLCSWRTSDSLGNRMDGTEMRKT